MDDFIPKILIINGPNLNLLGKREPEIYGNISFEDYIEDIRKKYPNIYIDYFQTNHEGAITDKLHEYDTIDCIGIILNAGAYTHTSIAIHDAITSINNKVIEIHISNIFKREEFRHKSYLSNVCVGSIIGLGLDGYELAINYLLNIYYRNL